MTMKCSLAPFTRGITRPASSPHQSERLVEVAVRVHIDGLDPLAVDSHGQTLAIGPLAPRHIAHRAAAEHNARCACGLDKVAPRSHGRPLLRYSCFVRLHNCGRARRDSILHCCAVSPFSFSIPTTSTNCVQRAMSSAMNCCTSLGP